MYVCVYIYIEREVREISWRIESSQRNRTEKSRDNETRREQI